MPCPEYQDLEFRRHAAWDRYRVHAYPEYRFRREVDSPEAAATIATEASRQRHELSAKMFKHQQECPICIMELRR